MPRKHFDVAVEFLSQGGTIFVHLNPRAEGVVVPSRFKDQDQLVLPWGYNMWIPIHDMVVNDSAISGVLSFSRAPLRCYVPWSAVYAIIGESGGGEVWPSNMPAHVARHISSEYQKKEAEGRKQRGRGHLRLVK